jgi:hypothetical protein
MSNRPLTKMAGFGLNDSRMSISAAGTTTGTSAVCTGVASASWYRCSRLAWSSRSARATASRTWTLALIGRPCSSHVYQVMPTPASRASSSRRSPGVRRRGPGGSPTSCGVTCSRRARRNLASSARRDVLARAALAFGWASRVSDTATLLKINEGTDIRDWPVTGAPAR